MAERNFWSEREVFTVALSERQRIRVLVSGPYGLREVEATIRFLEAQRELMRPAAAQDGAA